MSPLTKKAIRDVTRRRLRTTLTVLGIAIGVTGLTAISMASGQFTTGLNVSAGMQTVTLSNNGPDDATGVQVKDLDIGLLDFPCEVDGQTILLCWKLGEKSITHWHGTNEGFAGRKPIDQRIAKAKKVN